MWSLGNAGKQDFVSQEDAVDVNVRSSKIRGVV